MATFLAAGIGLWLAENVATYLGAWVYPDQLAAWRLVHARKISSWFLLGTVSFMLVAEARRRGVIRLRPTAGRGTDGKGQ